MATVLLKLLVCSTFLIAYVSSKKPHKTCGKNEELVENISAWSATCKEPYRPDCILDAHAPFWECLCKKGYVRADNKTCIPVDDCPVAECKSNEELVLSAASWEASCFTPLDPECYHVPHKPYLQCLCKEGYIRHEHNACIPKKDCPPRDCPSIYESRYIIGLDEKIEKTCNHGLIYPKNVVKEKYGNMACLCAKHYYRNNDYKCVLQKDCTKS